MLAYDVAGSLASRSLGFSYAKLTFVSFSIYFVIGLLAASVTNVTNAAFVAAGVAAVEATIGWAISWRLGPGQIPEDERTMGRIAGAILAVVAAGFILGLAGASVGSWL